jgi:hypothetical protein
MSPSDNETAVFALTRGYTGFKKWHYARLVLRNRALRRLVSPEKVDYLIFHEGNISSFDQTVLARVSGIPILFIDVGDEFKLKSHDVWTGTSDFGLGYSLMCRFNYEHVWKFLNKYEVVYRVDEDVVVISLPFADLDSDMLVGCLSEECHEQTNATLPRKLESMGIANFYDHKFPYTNCYVTKMSFWRSPDVQQFVHRIGEDPMAIENRWGDLPILGVALQSFGSWDPQASVDPRIRYVHGSHRASILGGRLDRMESPLRHKELGWIAWAVVALDALGSHLRAAKRLTQRAKSFARRYTSRALG